LERSCIKDEWQRSGGWGKGEYIKVRAVILFVLVIVLAGGCGKAPVSTTTMSPTVRAETFTPTGTFTPVSTATATMIPTLAPDVARDELFKMLKTNGNCNLPCWWGVIPGQSTKNDIHFAFMPFSSIGSEGSFRPKSGGIGFFPISLEDFNINLSLNYQLLEPNGQIEIIYVEIRQIKGDQYAPYADVFSLFSLQEILSAYGPPEDVGLEADLHQFELNAPTFFYIYLSYPDKGIYLRYTTPAEEISGKKIQSCPSEAYIDLWLTPPEKTIQI
jgi:hypothetical protein